MLIAIDTPMTVYGTMDNGGRDFNVTPSIFKNYKQITVVFEAIDPVEQTRKQQAGMVLFRGGAISRRTLQTEYLSDVVRDPVMEDTRMGVEAAESAFFGSPEFMQWAVAKYQAIQQEDAAGQQRQAVQNNAVSAGGGAAPPVAGGGGGGGAGVAASRTSTVEALAGGGADTSTRQQAAEVTNQVI